MSGGPWESLPRCFFILSLPERRPSQVDAQARLSETMCAAALHSVKSDLHSARAPAARSLTLSSLHPLRCKPRILAPHFHQALDTPTDGLRRPRAAHLGA